MSKPKTDTMRATFNFPAFDSQIQDWIKNQRSFSLSIRILIKNHIAKYGIGDVTALPLVIDENLQQAAESEVIAKPMAQIQPVPAVTAAPEIKSDFIAEQPKPQPEPVVQTVQTAPVQQSAVSAPEQTAQPSKMNDMLADLMK